ncbi:uncharacterized protein LOC116309047 [Actinia tenebrosa]|uniref:DNA 3'-5' helicase n=1 Tax=Actinia tenebrosa TaxID=6105 RepID=A0A6P8JCX0_ACTTE|nr:uncharacterized protein LOC116309047 [Actinia tenebrosa]
MASEREKYREILQRNLRAFPNISALKPEQEDCILAVLDKKDVFGILPTGFGKSLIFQLLPRIMKEAWQIERATVIVVTPLVSIMKDQVTELKEHGLNAFPLLNEESDEDILNSLETAELIYGIFETWLSQRWLKELKDGQLGKQIVSIVIDEVHSVTLW